MKRILALILAAFFSSLPSLAATSARADYYMSDGWKLYRSDSQVQYDATVPSTVLGTLTSNGLYERAFIGMNYHEMINRDDFAKPWVYEKRFSLPALNKGQRVSLNFEGISYSAEVVLNGRTLASRDEMFGPFRQYSFDVTDILSEENVLTVKVFRCEAGDFNIGFVDWNPRAADESMGIFRPVYLHYSNAVSIFDTAVRSKVDTESFKDAWLTVETTLKNGSAGAVSGVLSIKFNGGSFKKIVQLAAGESKTLALTSDEAKILHVKNPRLWWCHNLGTPEMYTLDASFIVKGKESDVQSVKFGIRQVDTYMTPEGHRGFVLNGKKVLVKGAGWTDDIFLRNTPERNDIELDYVKDMNLNAVRFENIWGTSQDIYDKCDEKGLLALVGWSCFWEWQHYSQSKTPHDKFGCIKSEEDMNLIAESFEDQVIWLRNHPSIIAWYVGSDALPRPALEKKYLEVLSRTDDRPYVGSAKALVSEVTGPTGMKMVGPYDYEAPSYWYDDKAPGGSFGFNTETGIGAQLPAKSSIKKMIPADQLWPLGKAYDYHCTAAGEAMNSLDVLKQMVSERYGEGVNLDDFLKKAHHLDYDGTRAMFEGFRVNVPKSTGVIQWMLNSAWPSLYWQMYDWYLVPTASYWSVKKACAPQQLVFNYVDKHIYAVNDEAGDFAYNASFQVYDVAGKLVSQGGRSVSMPAGQSVKLDEVPVPEGTSFLFLSLRDKAGVEVASNYYLLSSVDDLHDWKHYNWIRVKLAQHADYSGLKDLAPANVKQEIACFGDNLELTLTNESNVVAFFMELSLKDDSGELIVPAFWSDNFITLKPGETRTVTCRAAGAENASVEVSGWNVNVKKDYRIVAYYPAWRKYDTLLSDNVMKQITNVNLSFATVNADGSINDGDVCALMKDFAPLARKHGVEVLVSVGGGGGHAQQVSFSSAIHSPEAREKLVANLVGLADRIGLDGIDIDYEAWNVAEVATNDELEKDLEAFFKSLRKSLGKERLITSAVAGYGKYNAAMADCMDYATVMAYDLTGPWSKEAGPHSPFSYYRSLMKQFLGCGFPPEKLVGGVPFYGRGFKNNSPKEAFGMSYAKIVESYPGSEMADCVNDELWYDGFPAIDAKCSDVVDNGFGGIMFWEVTEDSEDPQKSLLTRIVRDLQ